MSFPCWNWHRTGSRWFPVRTLPVAPLWCDLVPNSRGNKASANSSCSVISSSFPTTWLKPSSQLGFRGKGRRDRHQQYILFECPMACGLRVGVTSGLWQPPSCAYFVVAKVTVSVWQSMCIPDGTDVHDNRSNASINQRILRNGQTGQGANSESFSWIFSVQQQAVHRIVVGVEESEVGYLHFRKNQKH